jgi:hypothetical protein
MQADDEALYVKVCGPQAAHWSWSTAPVEASDVPAGHARHDACPAAGW